MDRTPKARPAYAISSVDHALRLATMLQLEGTVTVTEAAVRLGVARSTAHRLLAMLVYRDFAAVTEQHTYRAGPVLELAAHSQSATSRLRARALPYLEELVQVVGESANLVIRTGDTARFIASVECSRALRVGNREGMVFPAHRLSGGLALLAELDHEQVESVYAAERYLDRVDERPEIGRLLRELKKVRSSGFALNQGKSERGVVAVGRPLRDASGKAIAALSISMPSVRYDPLRLRSLVDSLGFAVGAIGAELTASAT